MGLVSIVRFRIGSRTQKIKKLLKVPIFAIFERPGKSCTHFFSGGKAAEERPRICVYLAICTKVISGFTKYFHTTDAQKMLFFSLSNKLSEGIFSFNLLSWSCVSPSSQYCVSPYYAIYSVDLKYKDARSPE